MNFEEYCLEPDFERLRTALLCQGEPDHVPFVDPGIYAGHKARVVGHPMRGLPDEIEFALRMGYDFVPIKLGLLLTPGIQGAITSEADFENFEWPDPDGFDYSVLAEADKILPPNIKVLFKGKSFSPVWWVIGFEAFCTALLDSPDLIGRMFERVGSIQYRVLQRALEHCCVGVYWHGDNVAFSTGLMVSPPVLHQYVFPWFRRMVQLAHEHGVPAIYHSDGKLDPILEDIIHIGFDGLHSVEPTAMDIVQVKKRVEGRLCLLGNIDLRYTLTRGSPEEVDEEVRTRIGELAPGGGYCLSSSNSIPDYVSFDNYKAMHRAWLKYGKYPIQLDC